MALFVSCILTMHMMLYFFHHFELPFVLNTFQIRNQTIANFNNDPNTNRTSTAEPPRDGNLNDDEASPPDNIVLESNLDTNIEDHNEDELHEVELHISDLDDEMEEMLNDDDLIL